MRSYLQWCDDNRLYQRQSRIELGEFMTGMYQDSRPKVAHPVYEIAALPLLGDRGFGSQQPADPAQPMMIELPGTTLTEDLDALERVAVVRKRDQQGYRLGDLEHARAAFMQAVGDLPMPWQQR
jgi:hypothetical protein